MNPVYGAKHDLISLVTTHLFVIGPNHGGSTFLKEALATCRLIWNLPREGQHMLGFSGPSSRATGASLLWDSEPHWIRLFEDTNAYDWRRTRKAWYFQAFARDSQACMFVTKSPPFLLNVHDLDRHFNNAKFLFAVRNPYAVVEGIWRRRWKKPLKSMRELLDAAARHVLTCFDRQRRNIEAYRGNGRFFTYEAMCDEPEQVERMKRSLVPALDDLRLRQKLPIKQIYSEMLTNMNERQIARLTADQIATINRTFRKHRDILRHFSYDLIKTA